MQNNMEDQDWNIKEDPIFDKFNNLTTGGFNKSVNTDYKARNEREDYKEARAKIDWKTAKAKVDWSVALKDRTSKIDYKKIGDVQRGKSKHSQEHIKKMYKPVLQFDKQGNFIAEFSSAKEASIAIGKPGSDDIGTVCRGQQKTACGFIWKFKE